MVGLSRSGGKADKVEEGCDADHYNIATVSMSSTVDLLILRAAAVGGRLP
jgi:hypothetical protein